MKLMTTVQISIFVTVSPPYALFPIEPSAAEKEAVPPSTFSAACNHHIEPLEM